MSKKNFTVDATNSEKMINIALQGGGAHGAFAWGVLDKLLEDGRIGIEGISGTSAGSMNAVVLAYGLLIGGRDGARQQLHNFWKDISDAGNLYNPQRQMPWEQFFNGFNMEHSPMHLWCDLMSRWFSPYQLNPFNFNPLRDVLLKNVDFDHLQSCQRTNLFLSATNVHTGQVRVFHTDEVSADAVLASACLPNLFKAVEINGDYYWDGGYTGNPSLFPFYYHVDSSDILIIHINPIERPAPPTMPGEIFNRINEISFNSALLKEYRSIAFVHKLIDEGWLKDEFKDRLKYILLHSISADTALSDLSVTTKFSNDWNFLMMLRNRGRAAASQWLARNYESIGKESTVNLKFELAIDRPRKKPKTQTEKS